MITIGIDENVGSSGMGRQGKIVGRAVNRDKQFRRIFKYISFVYLLYL